MRINDVKKGDVLILELEGRLDTNTAPELEKVINNQTDDIKELFIDMKELDYISSAGLRVLLAAQKKMNKIGKLTVMNVCDTIMEVFQITGFVDVLNIE